MQRIAASVRTMLTVLALGAACLGAVACGSTSSPAPASEAGAGDRQTPFGPQSSLTACVPGAFSCGPESCCGSVLDALGTYCIPRSESGRGRGACAENLDAGTDASLDGAADAATDAR